MSNSTPGGATHRGGLSLYANLLDPTASGSSTTATSISREPVVFKADGEDSVKLGEVTAKKQQIDAGIAVFDFVLSSL